MKKSYVALTRINMTKDKFYVEKGDILTFDPANKNNLTVFRNGQIVKTTVQTQGGIDAMRNTRPPMIAPDDTTPQKAPAAPAVPAKAAAVPATTNGPIDPTPGHPGSSNVEAVKEEVKAETEAPATTPAATDGPIDPTPGHPSGNSAETEPEENTVASTQVVSAPAETTTEQEPDLEKMSYNDLLAHGNTVHGLKLTKGTSRVSAIKQINEAIAAKKA